MAQQWDTKFELLQRFVKEHNRFPKTNENYQGVQLGRWTRTQRIQEEQGALSDERKDNLLAIGFQFGNRREDNWRKHLAILEKYIKQHHEMPRASTRYRGVALGTWCSEQRKRGRDGRLPPHKREMLSAIGFDFDYDCLSQAWDKMFDILSEYVAENQRFPIYTEKYKGRAIGAWCAHQKNLVRAGKYDDSRRKRLEELGFQFEIKDREAVWTKMYELLQEYHDTYKRWPKFSESFKGFNLGIWCSNQKLNAKKESYPAERREKLLRIGMPLTVVSQESMWDARLECAKRFYIQMGRWPKETELWEGHHIGAWLGTQRRKSALETYPEHRRKKLEEAGILLGDK